MTGEAFMKAAIVLMFLAVLAPAQDRLADALRKGIVEEESNHNLPAAIQAYESLLKQADADRPTIATALFRIGECYRKLGKSEQATAAYKRVAEQYPDQARLAEQSRRHLPDAKKSAAAELSEAQRRYRALLEEEIKMAEDHAKRIRDSGETPETREAADAAQREALKLRRELAAFDANLPKAGQAAAETPKAAEARRQYKECLQKGVEAAKANLEYENHQLQLGAISPLEMYEPLRRFAAAQREIVAVDAGLTQLQPLGPATGEAAEARRKYGNLLKVERDYAYKSYDAEFQRFKLGMNEQRDLTPPAQKLAEAECRLTIFQAGFAPPAILDPGK
jgi:tetratricopeptide (TPR) repeat protein